MKFIKSLIIMCLFITHVAKSQVSVFAKVDHIIPDGIDTQGNITLTVSGSTAPYTYTWNPGAINTKDLNNITAGQYTVNVKSASSQTINCIYSLGYKVLWTNFERCYFRNDSLVSTAANVNAYSYASSRNTLAASTNGWFEYVIDNISFTNPFFIGFTDSIHAIPSSYIDMDYGIYRTSTPTTLYYYEAGVGNNVLKTGAKVGDVVRVERRSDSIIYKVNNVALRTVVVSGAGSKVFKLKANMRATNRILNVGCSFSKLDNTYMANYISVLPVIKHASDFGSTNGSINAIPKYPFANTYTWQPGSGTAQTNTTLAVGIHTLTIKDSLLNSSNYKYNIGYKVDWTNTDRAYFRNDSLVSPTVNASVYATAISKNTLPANTNGWFEYVIDNLGPNNYMIGFADDQANIQYRLADINFGLYYVASTKSFSYCEGAVYGALNNTPVVGDVIRIERTDSTINYKINGVTLAHAVTASGIKQKRFKIKTQMLSNNKLVNIGCSFYNKSNAVFDQYVQVYPLIKHNSNSTSNDGSIKITPRIPFANTYAWQGGASTNIITSLSPGNYSVTVKDSLLNESPHNFSVGYKVQWTNEDRCISRNDSLIATTNNANIVASAVSKNTLAANTNGWIEYVFDYNSPNLHYLGFVDDVFPYQYYYGDIDYGISFANNVLNAYESTVITPISYHLRIGDPIRIERRNDTIFYKVNGYTLRWQHVPNISQKELKVKANLTSVNRLVNVGCSFIKLDSTEMNNYVLGIPDITHNSSVGLTNGNIKITPRKPFANTYLWQPGNTTSSTKSLTPAGNYTVTIADSLANSSSYKYNVGYKPNWKGFSNANVSGDTLRGTITTTATASTNDTLMPGVNGWIEYVYTDQPGKSVYFGFLDVLSGTATAVTDIDFGYFFNTTPYVYYYQNAPVIFTYNPRNGDVYRVERSNDTIKYSYNNRLVRYTVSAGVSSKKLFVKAALVNKAKLTKLGISFTRCNFTATASTSQSITCTNTLVTLTGTTTATSGITYSWIPSGSSPTNSVTNVSSPGIFTLQVTSGSCAAQSTVSVHVNTVIPTVNTGGNQILTSAGTVSLNASVSGGVSPYSYSWAPTGVFSPTSDALLPNPTVSLSVTTTFSLNVTDAAGCSSNNYVNILMLTSVNPYGVLKKNHDGSYYQATNNKIYFKFEEEYGAGGLDYKIYDYNPSPTSSGNAVPVITGCSGLTAANDEYIIDLTTCSASFVVNKFYLLEVINSKKEKFYLKFKA